MTCETRLCVVFACAIVLAACGGETAGSPTAVSIAGRLGSAPSLPSEVMVLWSVSSGSPDYMYLFGRANVDGDSFELALRQRPPAEAMNNYGLGVGLIGVGPRAAGIPDGKLTSDDEGLLEALTGASERQAIIYVDHDQANAKIDAMSSTLTPEQLEQARKHWLFEFPQGYSCGNGRAPRAGERFDAYEPIDCDEVQVRLGELDSFDFPNWT